MASLPPNGLGTSARVHAEVRFQRLQPQEKGWVSIGDGDENWPEVMRALADVGYHGWARTEVAGGGKKELRDIAQRMDRIF